MKHLTKQQKAAIKRKSKGSAFVCGPKGAYVVGKKTKRHQQEKKPSISNAKKDAPSKLNPHVQEKKKEIILPLNGDQQRAFDILFKSKENVFLTGSAGTGKSHVVRRYLSESEKEIPVLAPTGAAAILVNGITFHRFFGLRTAELDDEKVIERAYDDTRVRNRILRTSEIIIDEISMINPRIFELANEITKRVKTNGKVFGGIRIIVTGDFFQLPPIEGERDDSSKSKWLFNCELWKELNFNCVELVQSMRTNNLDFIKILNKVRYGICDDHVSAFLDKHKRSVSASYNGTVLCAKKYQVEEHNQKKLASLTDENTRKFKTHVSIKVNYQIDVFKDSLIPEYLNLKNDAVVMLRKNDPENRFVNGTIGRIVKISNESLTVSLPGKLQIQLEKETFEIKDGDGKVIAEVTNFPIVLGWALTIHKSQGASLEFLSVNLSNLWETGQAYVALSRATNPDKLFIEDWNRKSIKADSEVIGFYKSFLRSDN